MCILLAFQFCGELDITVEYDDDSLIFRINLSTSYVVSFFYSLHSGIVQHTFSCHVYCHLVVGHVIMSTSVKTVLRI